MTGTSPVKGTGVVPGSQQTTDSSQPDSRGLGPAIHVFGAEILADLRRGCPGRARARAFGTKIRGKTLGTNCRPIFPGQPCRLRGEREVRGAAPPRRHNEGTPGT